MAEPAPTIESLTAKVQECRAKIVEYEINEIKMKAALTNLFDKAEKSTPEVRGFFRQWLMIEMGINMDAIDDPVPDGDEKSSNA